MNANLIKGFIIGGLTAAILHGTASACSVCMGDPNSAAAGATNGAIFLMLGIIGTMLTASGGFGLYLYKRAHTPIPPHLELVEEMSEHDDEQSHA
jgi:hypothetical protein